MSSSQSNPNTNQVHAAAFGDYDTDETTWSTFNSYVIDYSQSWIKSFDLSIVSHTSMKYICLIFILVILTIQINCRV